MNSLAQNSVTIGVVISFIAYFIGTALKKKFKLAIFNPLLISILLVMAAISVLRIDYDTYNSSAKYLSYLLTPSTVALAIPLYMKLDLLKKNIVAIFAGITAGCITSMASVLALAVLFRLSHAEYVTLLPKSITSAIGMGVAEEFGGYAQITVAVIILTGIIGNLMAPFVLKLFRVKNKIAVGLAMGTGAHAMGTAGAMEIGETEGAMASLAIVVAGLLTVIGAGFFQGLY